MKLQTVVLIGIGCLTASVPAQAQLLEKLLPKAVDEVSKKVLSTEASAQTGGADVPDLLQARWGLSEAHCMQAEPDPPGIVVIDDRSIQFDNSRGMFGAPIAKGKNFMRSKVNYLTDAGPMQRDLSIHVRSRSRMSYTEYTDYGSRVSETCER